MAERTGDTDVTSGLLTVAAETTPARAASRARSWRPWVLGATALAVFAAGLGYLTGNEVQANAQHAQAQHSLHVTDQRITVALAQLASVSRDLESADVVVDQTTVALADDALELLAAQNALTQAQVHVSQQGTSITVLQSCLAGVEQALNALSVGDGGSALSALTASMTSCQSAVATNG